MNLTEISDIDPAHLYQIEDDKDYSTFDAIKSSLSNYEYYPPINEKDFYEKIFNKTEFSFTPLPFQKNTEKNLHQIQPHQLFVKNFLSPHTPYNGLLLFYGTGAGKTCASLNIAEQLRPIIESKGGKIIILGRSREHVKNIFMKEMYDVYKEIYEINENLPKGSSHCLGATYFQSSGGRLIDENSFFVTAKKIRKKIQESYDFYGFRQFHTKVKDIEESKEYLEDYFDNCIFIIDEAHNLSGLEQTEGSAEEPTEDEPDTPNLELVADKQNLVEAEKIRIKLIRFKRKLNLNLLAIKDHVAKISYQPDESREAIKQLDEENRYLRQQMEKLRKNMCEELTAVSFRELKKIAPNEEDDQLREFLKQLIDKIPDIKITQKKLEIKTISEETLSEADDEKVAKLMAGSKIYDFLLRYEKSSCLKNVFDSFLKTIKDITGEQGEKEIEGLKAYQALKKVLLSINQSKVILLTATPMRDRPQSIVNLLNILRVNDGFHELQGARLFPGGSPNLPLIEEKSKGYVSYYRGNDAHFPEVIWDLERHPNEQDRDLLKKIRSVELKLNPRERHSPSIKLIKCQSKAKSPQEEEYARYLYFYKQEKRQDSGDLGLEKKKKTQLEYRCNFALPITEEMFTGTKGDFKEYRGDRYLVTYSQKNFFDQLFTYVPGPNESQFSYKNKKLGDFLHPDQVGKYSSKIATLLTVLNQVSTRKFDGKMFSGGLNLIYSKMRASGCYLIALTLEKMGYRKYRGQSLWKDPERELKRSLCSICNRDKADHDPEEDGHKFKQAHYIIAVGSSDEVNKYMDILKGKSNQFGEEIKVVIGTSTITEGLDFKYIRYIHVFEPYYNFTRLDQLAGRGSRQGSHSDFFEGDYDWKNVTMFLYTYFMSTTRLIEGDDDDVEEEYQYEEDEKDEEDEDELEDDQEEDGSVSGTSIQQYDEQIQEGGGGEDETPECQKHKYKGELTRDLENYLITLEKDCQIKKVEQSLKKIAVDCPLYLDRNYRTSDEDYSRVCHYQKCQYSCPYLPPKIEITKRGDKFEFDGKKIKEDEGISDLFDLEEEQTVVGFHSRVHYIEDRPFLEQLVRFGDIPKELSNGETTTACWIIDKKDYSTFYPYMVDSMAEQLLPLIKYLIMQPSLNKPIFSLTQISNLIDQYISFNVDLKYRKSLYYYALSLISGTFVPKHLKFNAFSIIPLKFPNDIYYVLHPNFIQDVNTSTYYKHAWPKTLQKRVGYVDLSKWQIESKKGEDIQSVIGEYLNHLSSKPYNQFELYSVFSKQDDEELSELLYNLITYTFDEESFQFQYNLAFYLAHFLEYKSLVHISRCYCDHFVHKDLRKSKDEKNLVLFYFQFKNSGVLKIEMVHGQSITHESTQLTNIQSFEDNREESTKAAGSYEFLKSERQKVFKLKNNLRIIKLQEKLKTKNIPKREMPRFRNCKTFKIPDEDDDTPGLVSIYDNILERTKELNLKCRHQPPFYIATQTETKGKIKYSFSMGGKDIKKTEKDMRGLLCLSIETYLHFLHFHDPKFHYFQYLRDKSSTPAPKATPVKKKKK